MTFLTTRTTYFIHRILNPVSFFALLAYAAVCAGGSVDAFADNGRARSVYKTCAPCHGNNGEGKPEVAAPSIAGLPEWYIQAQLEKFRAGVRGTHPKDEAGMRMRPLSRTLTRAEDVQLVSAYVAEMKHVDSPRTITGNVVKGEEQYKVCIACHGADAGGNKDLNAPPLKGANDWYLYTQLKNFKNKIRAGNPATDPTGATMAPMAALLDDAGMKDVVSYINALK
jgi:cytochrome c553